MHLKKGQRQQLTVLYGVSIMTMMLISPALADISSTVKRGDSIAMIKLQLSTPQLASNGICTPNRIYPGTPVPVVAIATVATATIAPPAVEVAAAAPVVVEVPAEMAAETPEITAPAERATKKVPARDLFAERSRIIQERETNTGNDGEVLVASAREFTGTPYSWGGTSSRGIDCSGLVVRAMEAQGIEVPHRAAELYTMGTSVAREELKAGDLVFFETGGHGVSHVGIYVNNNTFIHASTSSGVKESELSGYYAKHYMGAKRLK